MENGLHVIFCTEAVQNFLTEQEGLCTRKDKILPLLQPDAMKRCFTWGKKFWSLCKSVCVITAEKVIFVLVHMDQKWFNMVVTRENYKMLISIGLKAKNYYTHHQNYTGK